MRPPIPRTPNALTKGQWPPCPSPRPKTRRHCKAIPSPLTGNLSTVTARLWVGTAATVEDLTLTVTETPAEGQQFSLQSVTLTEQPIWRATSLVGWLLLFAAADWLLSLLFLGDSPRAPRCGWGVVLLVAGGIVLASLPYCADFLYTGHDLRFHCYRIWAVAQALADGQPPGAPFHRRLQRLRCGHTAVLL